EHSSSRVWCKQEKGSGRHHRTSRERQRRRGAACACCNSAASTPTSVATLRAPSPPLQGMSRASAAPWLVLVGTRAAFFDLKPIVALVQRLLGRWHEAEPPDPLPSDAPFLFWYMPSASATALADISVRRSVSAVIVAPEPLPRSVRARLK